MKKSTLTLVIILIHSITYSQKSGNYILIINNDTINVDLDKDISYKTASGETLTIQVTQPEILEYSDDMISFSYQRSLGVSNAKIDDGIEQCMVMKSTGSGFMVQKFKTINPSGLTRFMLNEIIKESINYGYVKTEKEFKKKLLSGETIEGVQATLKYNDDTEIYTIATYGNKDQGIIVVTMQLNDDFDDTHIIELFLNTLRIK